MKILVTGALGFVGRNLVATLNQMDNITVFEYDINSRKEDLIKYVNEADFIYHLAGVNRPKDTDEFYQGNFGFTSELLDLLNKKDKKTPLMLSSSIQAAYDNDYGKSKAMGEDLIFNYGQENQVPVYVYRFKNLFGKWSRPNYNTVVATFCYNIARGIEISVDNPDATIELCYIDDVVRELVSLLDEGGIKEADFYTVPETYTVTVGQLALIINEFKQSRVNLTIPDMSDEFVKKLYATYLSFLPKDSFAYDLKMNIDNRGSFTEFIRTPDRGQVSVNVAKPGITKGQHWHHTKNEKFLVVSGEGVIRFRKPDEVEIIEYFVSGEKLQVVDIPVGYTHNIENVGDTDLVTIMWVNEPFNPSQPDTFFEVV